MIKVIQEKCDADLVFIFSQEELDAQLQYDIVEAGYNTMRTFAKVDDEKAGVRMWLKDEIKIGDRLNAQQARLAASQVLSCWDLARAHKMKGDEGRAITRASSISR